MAQYDPAILQKHSNRLYAQADSIIAIWTIAGILLGALGGSLLGGTDSSGSPGVFGAVVLEPDTAPQPLRAEVERLRREIQGCDRQTQRLVDAYQRGAVEMEDLLLRRKEIEGRKTLLADSLKQAEAALQHDQVRRDIRAQLPDFVRHVSASLESADFHTRQRLVRLLIDRVVIQPNLDVEIHYVLAALGRVGDANPNPPAGDCGPSAGASLDFHGTGKS